MKTLHDDKPLSPEEMNERCRKLLDRLSPIGADDALDNQEIPDHVFQESDE